MANKKKPLTPAEMGRLGAKALHSKFTPEQRSERARQLAQARWSKVNNKNTAHENSNNDN
jgi:hypothetical protein